MDWTHDELARDLAGHLKAPARMVWLNIQLGPSGSPRPDVYALSKSYVRPCPVAYEVKISREDFRADVTTAKWSSYLEYAHGVIFAVPKGLVAKSEVPEHCGLIVRHEQSWRLAKRPVLNVRPIAQEALLKLLIDGVEREGPGYRARAWAERANIREFERRFGAEAARYVSDATCVLEKIQRAEERAKEIVDYAEQRAKDIVGEATTQFPGEWKDLATLLSLEAGASFWDMRRKIENLKAGGDGDAGVLRNVLNQLRRIVQINEQRE